MAELINSEEFKKTQEFHEQQRAAQEFSEEQQVAAENRGKVSEFEKKQNDFKPDIPGVTRPSEAPEAIPEQPKMTLEELNKSLENSLEHTLFDKKDFNPNDAIEEISKLQDAA